VQLAENTCLDYEWRLEVHLIPFFAETPLDRINGDLIDRYVSETARTLRALALGASLVGIGLGGCGSSRPVGDSRISGSVEVCHPLLADLDHVLGHRGPAKCSPVATLVSLLRVESVRNSSVAGHTVARRYAPNGDFSFAVSPGKYFPSTPGVRAQLHGGNCIAGVSVVRARESVRDDVRCVSLPRPSLGG
jgi:hypothetical protein